MHLGTYVVFYFFFETFFIFPLFLFSFISCLLLGSFFLGDSFRHCLLIFIVYFFLFPPPPPPSINALALSKFPTTGETIVTGVFPIVFLTL